MKKHSDSSIARLAAIRACFPILLLLILPAAVRGQFTFTTNNSTITITGYTGLGGDVAIPNSINSYPVVSIAQYAFYDQTSLTSVKIGTTVTSIGVYAFYSCTLLTNVTIPNSLTNIGDHAFGGCTLLTGVTIPNSVTSIGFGAFTGTSLTSIAIPNSITSIADETFAFTVLTNIAIPNSVTNIGARAFGYCASLTNVTIPNTVTSILEAAFEKCGGLVSVTIPNSVNSIADGLFNYCTNLTNVSIPNSVVSIGYWAFAYCTSMTSVAIPTGVTSINGDAFYGCASLTNIEVAPLNEAYSSANGILFDKGQTTLLQYPRGNRGSYVIPSGVRSIGDYAFHGCTLLTGVTIPNSVTNIGISAFANCSSLTNVTVPDSVSTLGEFAFSQSGLITVTIGSRVIGLEAFYYCTSLSSATIGNGVSFSDWCFFGCTNLTGVYFRGNCPTPNNNMFGADSVIAYHLPGTAGWGTTLAGRPTALWALPYPVILTITPSFGLQTNGFGFTISWATNVPVVVEASADLAHSTWSPISTNALVNGSFYFSDAAWTNYPSRFYRIRSP